MACQALCIRRENLASITIHFLFSVRFANIYDDYKKGFRAQTEKSSWSDALTQISDFTVMG
jgi:hypothetical protein